MKTKEFYDLEWGDEERTLGIRSTHSIYIPSPKS